jgi:hypothetical protein
MKKETRGRKPSPDKKLTVCLYIETSKIEKAGGIEKMKERLYSSLDGEVSSTLSKVESMILLPLAEERMKLIDVCSVEYHELGHLIEKFKNTVD